MNIRKFFTFAAMLSASSLSSAETSIAYEYPLHGRDKKIMGIVSNETVGCSRRIMALTIDSVDFLPGTDEVTGFRAEIKNARGERQIHLFQFEENSLYKKLPNSERPVIQNLIRRGEQVIVTYDICGNGGYFYVHDIFSRQAINKF